MDRVSLARRLTQVSVSLRDKYTAIATAKAAEIAAKSNVIQNELPNGTAVTQIDRLATAQSAPFSVTSIKLFYSILALEEERDHLRFLLKYQLESEAG